ncbi:baseplate J/gp47 family protein [Serratia sp. M24T3]|uniref:baseplate J/gp47 family protein n=1 Tax=Serratia sp. M24T3 TaxID=932213 RepID=UPI00025B9F64|nr:baseplate J/gp47 family protein [Serratia sp. M24T3]EIC83960.1 putative bacteriophage protein [Serratia sp. M24T3]
MTTTTTVSTAVPSMTFSTEGITAPDLIDVLNGSLTDAQTAYGTDASTDLTTPQGQYAMVETAIVGDKNDQLLAFANMINPDYSSGRFQDAIGQMYFIDRNPATGTTVTATCTGLVDTDIPSGSYAQDTSGYIYYSTADATIGSDGTASVVFTNSSTGPIECAAGTLTTIYQAVTGWSGITNDAAGVLGSEEESRNNFEWRRRQMVTANSKNTIEALYAALLGITDVTDVYVFSNNTTTVISKGSTAVSIPVGTAYIAVYGGDSSDVADAFYNKLNPGCATECSTSNETSYTVTDDTNYTSNYPEYTYYWTVPTTIPVYVNVTLESNDYLPQDLTSSVQSIILEAFNGEDGGTRARIGSTIYAGRYYGGVQDIDQQNINILSIELSTDNSTFSTSLEFGIDEIPTLSSSNITVSLSS